MAARRTQHTNSKYGAVYNGTLSERSTPFVQDRSHMATTWIRKALNKTALLILDDWLRDKPTLAEAQSLLDILDDRYGRTSTLLAAQFPIATWHSRIPDPTLADAILDRLVHNAHRIELQGDSQRKLRAERAMSST